VPRPAAGAGARERGPSLSQALATDGLTKRFGVVPALEDLTLRVEEGEVFGFLGPNGAGKTTTIRLLLGLLAPSGGAATVLGHRVTLGGAGWRAELGYLPGEVTFWPHMTGRVTLDFLGRLSRRPAVDQAVLLERLGLAEDTLRRPVRTYSDGMRQKLGIVQALQCRPRLALLDEPTKGLDPLVQEAFHALVAEARRNGTTVFVSSHVLSEVQRLCDRVAMLREGHLVFAGDVDELRRSQRRRVTATFAADVDHQALAHFGEVLSASPREIALRVAQEELPALVARLGMLPVTDLVVEPPSLEEAFLEHYR
jgi:ABC-2 type transport system ATP-binding protein